MNFQHHYSYSVSRDPSKIILIRWSETFLISVETVLLLNMFMAPWHNISGLFYNIYIKNSIVWHNRLRNACLIHSSQRCHQSHLSKYLETLMRSMLVVTHWMVLVFHRWKTSSHDLFQHDTDSPALETPVSENYQTKLIVLDWSLKHDW